jgi:hypothetical protein
MILSLHILILKIGEGRKMILRRNAAVLIAALADGFGLIEPVDGKFLPKAVVSRAEAATTLVKFLKTGK